MDKRAKLLSQPTLAELFLTAAGMRLGKTAYVTKNEKGRFKNITTYGQLLERSYRFASALIGEGYKVGDICAVMANPSLEFSIMDNGTTMTGAVTGGIYVTDTSELLEYKLNHLEAKVFVIENAVIKGTPQMAKLLRIPREKLPHLKKIVVSGEFGTPPDDRFISFDEFSNSTENMDKVSDMIYQLEPGLPAVIIYSSGTQGWPKGAILTHHNIMSNIRQADTKAKMEENKRYMDFLPPAHVFGYMVRRSVEGLGAAIYVSHRDTLADDLPAVSPHIIAGVPKFFNALMDRIRTKVAAMNVDVDSLQDFQKELILRAAGLADAEVVITGAAAIPNETVLFFKNKLGFQIDQAYGVTETSPGISSNYKNDWKLGSVGTPFGGVEVKIVDDNLEEVPRGAEGEIAVHGDNVFTGYFKDEERTKKVLRQIGGKTFYLTGDVGRMDADGYLFITDRKDDMLVPVSGENVSSASIENKIGLLSRFIGYVVPYGTGRDYITAVVWPDETKHEHIRNAAREAGIADTEIHDILYNPNFRDPIEKDLNRVLKLGEFNSHERPRGFLFLVNPGEEEVTGTMKARKKGVRGKFAPLLDELYKNKTFLKIIRQ